MDVNAIRSSPIKCNNTSIKNHMGKFPMTIKIDGQLFLEYNFCIVHIPQLVSFSFRAEKRKRKNKVEH